MSEQDQDSLPMDALDDKIEDGQTLDKKGDVDAIL